MPVKGIINRVKDELGRHLGSHSVKGDRRFYAVITRGKVLECARCVLGSLEGRLSTITALDKGHRFELVYHFTFDKEGVVGSFRCVVPKFNPAVDSLTSLTPAANWIEREIRDLFGITFVGHPQLEKLVLSDDWPLDKHPLRKVT